MNRSRNIIILVSSRILENRKKVKRRRIKLILSVQFNDNVLLRTLELRI